MITGCLIGEIITLFLMATALGMDAFSIGMGMGMLELRLKQMMKIGIVIGVFHVVMPLLGMLVGFFLSHHFGSIAAMIGGVLLLLLGAQMMLASLTNKEDKPLVQPIGFGLFIFAVSASLDSFSVGLSLGIFGARVLLTIFMFGFMSMILTWLGLMIGQKAQRFLGRYSEAFGGFILFTFGLKILLHAWHFII
ncbi:putative Mn2+ efflux pump MntP [Scopulibacillus daqui]|uniref:Putative manganese efflux pump MntP n=1 Tax=Scopulibacillus daqui TaxID=1469162 RepID=A0ABS2PZA1_9BACL|nr:manganese efflux pump MntP family protein [Scopulibacillus daqui]MBM7645373.1 putative Mn2+ efflux pump MntP [Scopulibacillus daqui]